MRRSLPSILLFALVADCAPAPFVIAPVPLSAPATYDDAVAMAGRRQAEDDSVVVAGGRSLLLTHGAPTARVFVLLHGFTDLPEQFAVVGQHLFASGDNVYIPRLPRHAERHSPMRSLGRISAEELARFGDSSMTIARGLGDTIVVVGLSAGGVVAASVAQSHPEVRRAVLIAPAIAAGVISNYSERGMVVLASKLPEITRTEAPMDTARSDYVQGITTHGLAQVLRLGQLVREAAADGDPGAKNMYFLLNEADHTVSEQAALDVAQQWFDHGARVAVYRFPATLKLQHNVMATDARGGNVALVFPVIEALARGERPSNVPELQRHACGGWQCLVKRALKP